MRRRPRVRSRVRARLVGPLLRRGLAKPASLTNEAFATMCDDLCQRLAYMSMANLAALEEVAADQPSGKQADRFPIAQKLLKLAADIQPPDDSASPLIRAVFAAALGRDAIAGGWAPELLAGSAQEPALAGCVVGRTGTRRGGRGRAASCQSG